MEPISRSEKPMRVILISGVSGSGKTQAVEKIVLAAKQQGWKVGGILAPGTFQSGERFSFDLVDVATNKRIPFASRGQKSCVQFGPFGFESEGFAFGEKAIREALSLPVDLLLVDEMGPMELQNRGWAHVVREAKASAVAHILCTVRPSIVPHVVDSFWRDENPAILPVDQADEACTIWKISE